KPGVLFLAFPGWSPRVKRCGGRGRGGCEWSSRPSVAPGDACNNCPAGLGLCKGSGGEVKKPLGASSRWSPAAAEAATAAASLGHAEESGERIKESLRNIEQTYKIFQQQQFTFIAALEHVRENAHDKIKPVSSIGQRILLMFLNICCELHKLCQRLESLHPGNATTNAILEKCKMYVSHSNDLSGLRAKYPHDVVNHLSCDEARNHYGGVVSLIPIVLDCMKEWVAHTEKLPRNMLQSAS
ncbi:hypothetical protein E2320_006656, partial [Naja naja]